MKTIRLCTLIATFIIIFSCEKDINDEVVNSNEERNIEFNISFTDKKNKLKSKQKPSLNEAKQIVLTIQKKSGESTDYTSKKIELYKIGNEFFSQKLSLKLGNYKITEFFLLDDNNNIIYVVPLASSKQAQNISSPLPINFSIAKDKITPIAVEVLSTHGLKAEDFGLAGLPFSEVKTYSFLINVSEKGQMDSLLTAPLNIKSGAYSFSQSLEAIANNIVTIKSGYSDYTLTISKDGFSQFSHLYTIDSLKKHASIPLTIELEKINNNNTVTDVQGNIYKTVKIGQQTWMAENLKTTLYNDGTPIEFPRTDVEAWEDNTTGAYALYNNDEILYGMLYNWYAVNTKKLCPTGWHIPSDEEWLTLSTFLGGSSVAGGKMKVTNGSWESPNVGATNTSGFSAYPAGWAYFASGHYSHRGNLAAFWSSDEGIDENHGISRQIDHDSAELERYTSSNSSNKGNGFSCRCIKD